MSLTPREKAEAILENMPNPPDILLAAYVPNLDCIIMPYYADKTDFAYYSVLFHECIHMTFHESRLGGVERYSTDEHDLIAEVGSALLSAHVGLIYKTLPWHEETITDLLVELQDKSQVETACQEAERACHYITSKKITRAILPLRLRQLLSV